MRRSTDGSDPGELAVAGPYAPWHGAAYQGVWKVEGTTRRVLVLLGPDNPSVERALDRARALSARALALRTDGVLPLRAVLGVGARVAWVHDHVEGLGLGHVVGTSSELKLSCRAAGELVASVADTLISLGDEGLRHRGPEPLDLLVDPSGTTWLAGFAGPFPRSPAARASEGGATGPALVFRLGALLAHLLSGAPPGAASQETAHNSQVRRALIRAMARPGPVLADSYAALVRAMLAWDADARPALGDLPARLRAVAAETGGVPLDDWAAANVSVARRQILGQASISPAPRRVVDPVALAAVQRAAVRGEPPSRTGVALEAEGTSWLADPDDDAPTQQAVFATPSRAAHRDSEPPAPATPPSEAPSDWLAMGDDDPDTVFEPVLRRTSTAPIQEDDDPTQEGLERLAAASAEPPAMPVAVGPAPGRTPAPAPRGEHSAPAPRPAPRPAPPVPAKAHQSLSPSAERGAQAPLRTPTRTPAPAPAPRRRGLVVAAGLWLAGTGLIALVGLVAVVATMMVPGGAPEPDEAPSLADVMERRPVKETPEAAAAPAAPAAVEDTAAPVEAVEPGAADPDPPAEDPAVEAAPALEDRAAPSPEPPSEAPERAAASPPEPSELPPRPDPPAPFEPPPAPPPVTSSTPPPSAPFEVVIRSADPGMELKVKCNAGSYSGVGEVRIVQATPGPCVVQGGSHESGGITKAHVVITGPAAYTCFGSIPPRCDAF